MILIKLTIWVVAIICILFLWLMLIKLNKPVYNSRRYIWEQNPEAKAVADVVIALTIIISFLLGWLGT